MMNVTS